MFIGWYDSRSAIVGYEAIDCVGMQPIVGDLGLCDTFQTE